MRIDLIKLKGIERPAQANMAAILRFAKATKRATLLECFFLDNMEEEDILQLLHASLVFGADAAGQHFDMSYAQFVEEYYHPDNTDEDATHFVKVIVEQMKEPAETLKKRFEKKMAANPDLQSESLPSPTSGTSTANA